jgi:hypothetical protein
MRSAGAVLIVATLLTSCGVASRGAYEQAYLPDPSNWLFRHRFPRADRLFNGFDYGHAILYQTLLTRPDAPHRLEGQEFEFITERLLRHPPSVPLEEAAVGPDYVKLVPEVAAMFDWAHVLHRQLYDVLSEYGRLDTERDDAVHRILANYRSRADLAFSSEPKSMMLMEGQPYSLAFRRRDPKFNGLLWAYHWLQMALYDALLEPTSWPQIDADVDATVNRFFTMLDDAPRSTPSEMPMAADASPRFAARYPDAANVFDNLHALHDVVSDILSTDTIPRARKRALILAAAAEYRSDAHAAGHRHSNH